MARAIIRFSLDGDNGTVSTAARNLLEKKHGFIKIGTSSYECDGATQLDCLHANGELAHLFTEMNAKLDHLWVYIDDNPLA